MFERLKKSINRLSDKLTKTEVKGEKLGQFLEEFKITLIENDVALNVADRLCEIVEKKITGVTFSRVKDKKAVVEQVFRETVDNILQSNLTISLSSLIEDKRSQNLPTVIIFLGVNGTGKTTSIAKTAYYLLKKGYTVVLASGDTFRTGSIEQLREHARRVGVKTIEHQYGSDSAAVAFDAVNYARAHGINVVLIDTAGRMQTDRNLMDEVAKVSRVAKPDLKILVVDALTANDAIEQCRVFNDSIGVDAVFMTKLDADAKGGAALSVMTLLNKPILFVGTGQGYSDLAPFDSEFLINNLFD
ncbi:signal recognition particle-docking protein FtsY [[Eubacterium] cellulosolvens]